MNKTAGFTKDQISCLRNRWCEAGGMDDFEKCADANSTLVSSLIGAGLGGGLGLVSDAIRPADPDERRGRRRLASILGGLVLGGIAGAGVDQLKKNSPLLFPPKRSLGGRALDAIDPSLSTAVAAGGIGYWARPHLTNGGALLEALQPHRSMFNGQPINLAANESRELSSALSNYERVVSNGKLRNSLNNVIKFLTGNRLKPFEDLARTRSQDIERTAGLVFDRLSQNHGGQMALNNIRSTEAGKYLGDRKLVAEALSHGKAKLNRMSSRIGRGGRAAALAAGILALGYKLGK